MITLKQVLDAIEVRQVQLFHERKNKGSGEKRFYIFFPSAQAINYMVTYMCKGEERVAFTDYNLQRALERYNDL